MNTEQPHGSLVSLFPGLLKNSDQYDIFISLGFGKVKEAIPGKYGGGLAAERQETSPF